MRANLQSKFNRLARCAYLDAEESPGREGLGQGAAEWVACGQTVRYLPLIPGSRFSPPLMAGHAPQSDRPATIAHPVEETAARAAGRTGTLRAIA